MHIIDFNQVCVSACMWVGWVGMSLCLASVPFLIISNTLSIYGSHRNISLNKNFLDMKMDYDLPEGTETSLIYPSISYSGSCYLLLTRMSNMIRKSAISLGVCELAPGCPRTVYGNRSNPTPFNLLLPLNSGFCVSPDLTQPKSSWLIINYLY